MKRLTTFLLMAGLLATGSALAQDPPTVDIDYLGWAWGTDEFPPVDLGADMLTFVGVADYVDPMFGVSLDDYELTFYMFGMEFCGSEDLGNGTTKYYYCNGYLDIYMDTSKDADWGTYPPNPTAPSTFTNGIRFFYGPFTEFAMYRVDAMGYSYYEGILSAEDGWLVNEVCDGCAFTWGGAFEENIAQVIEGYDLQMDGVLTMDITIDNENQTWSTVKTLFR